MTMRRFIEAVSPDKKQALEENFKVTHTPNVQLHYSADQWELFDHLPGAAEAAHDLNKTFMDAVNGGCDSRETYRRMSEVMKKHSHLGAQDSEPIWQLENLMRKVYPDWDN